MAHVHSDILKMPRPRRRGSSSNGSARGRFFFFWHEDCDPAKLQALAMARHSDHPDARFLVTLLPRPPPCADKAALSLVEFKSGMFSSRESRFAQGSAE